MKLFLSVIALAIFSFSATAQVSSQSVTNLKFKLPQASQTDNSLSKINPLVLLIEIDKGGFIQLNSQSAGTLSNSAVLIGSLRDVIKERKKAGIYREGTNEVETAVSLRVDRAANYRDVVNLIGGLKKVGVDPLSIVTAESEIPVAVSGAEEEDKTVIIEITENGEYFIGNQKADIKTMKQTIARKTKTGGKDDSILFKAASNVTFGSIQDLLEAF